MFFSKREEIVIVRKIKIKERKKLEKRRVRFHKLKKKSVEEKRRMIGFHVMRN